MPIKSYFPSMLLQKCHETMAKYPNDVQVIALGRVSKSERVHGVHINGITSCYGRTINVK